MRSLRSLAVTFTLCALSLGSHCATASAQDAFFPTGTYTIDATHSVVENAYVGLNSGGFATDSMGNPYDATVNLVAGGSVGASIDVYNSSQVNVSGGSVGEILAAINSSSITISGGTFGLYLDINFSDDTTGSFTFVGHNLAATNVGPDYTLNGTNYDLSGTLLDSTNISGYIINVRHGATLFTLDNVPATTP